MIWDKGLPVTVMVGIEAFLNVLVGSTIPGGFICCNRCKVMAWSIARTRHDGAA